MDQNNMVIVGVENTKRLLLITEGSIQVS